MEWGAREERRSGWRWRWRTYKVMVAGETVSLPSATPWPSGCRGGAAAAQTARRRRVGMRALGVGECISGWRASGIVVDES